MSYIKFLCEVLKEWIFLIDSGHLPSSRVGTFSHCFLLLVFCWHGVNNLVILLVGFWSSSWRVLRIWMPCLSRRFIVIVCLGLLFSVRRLNFFGRNVVVFFLAHFCANFCLCEIWFVSYNLINYLNFVLSCLSG